MNRFFLTLLCLCAVATHGADVVVNVGDYSATLDPAGRVVQLRPPEPWPALFSNDFPRALFPFRVCGGSRLVSAFQPRRVSGAFSLTIPAWEEIPAGCR